MGSGGGAARRWAQAWPLGPEAGKGGAGKPTSLSLSFLPASEQVNLKETQSCQESNRLVYCFFNLAPESTDS